MNFVAIDFETANESRNSACAIGITKVKGNKIVSTEYHLIKPPKMRFNAHNIWIHGIYPQDVENEMTFGELWPKIKHYFDEELVVAHNAAFDLSVLRSLLNYYGFEYPNLHYICTVLLSKNKIKDVRNHKLNTLAEYVGHKFEHHHAGEDATACAKILIHISENYGIKDLLSLHINGGLNIGSVYDRGYEPCTSLIKHKNNDTKKEALSLSLNENTEYFLDKTVVFTGPLDSMRRNEAFKIVMKLGGIIGTSVTKKTDVLITGIKGREYLDDMYKSTKLKKAESLINNGQNIDILTEEEFLSIATKEGITH